MRPFATFFPILILLSGCVQNYVSSTVTFASSFADEVAFKRVVAAIEEKTADLGGMCEFPYTERNLISCEFSGNGDLIILRGGISAKGESYINVISNRPTYLVVSKDKIRNGYLPHLLHGELESWIFSLFPEFEPTERIRSWQGVKIPF